jgi:hypothetical protein
MFGAWIAIAVSAVAGALVILRRRGARPRSAAVEVGAVIAEPSSATSRDAATGAVRSLQEADVLLPREALEQIWTPAYLERLARTYWRFLSRVTLGLVRVRYGEDERSVVLLVPALKLITFYAPEYEMDAMHGLVRWRVARGLLVARRGRDGDGFLQIKVRRSEAPAPGGASGAVQLHVEVEVANFYPSIASRLSRRLYDATQSRIHVVITRGFLRSLRRLDLAESKVGRLAGA